MRMLTMASTSVLSARTRSFETLRYGLVVPAGQYSISLASRSGLQVKAPAFLSNKTRMERCHLLDSGDALAAIYRKTICPTILPVGVKKRWIHAHSLGFLRFLVARHAHAIMFFPNHALINVRIPAMLARVHLVLKWAQLKAAFVDEKLLLVSAWIRITRMVGAVAKSVARSCLVESISASVYVTKVFVERVRC
jgi:hypothetical protein